MSLSGSQTIEEKVPLYGHQISHILFHCPSYSEVADQILRQPECHDFVRKGTVHWNTFEDGFPNLMIDFVDSIRGRDVVFLADFLDLSSMFAQLSVIYALPRYCIRSLTLVLPYFPTGTMERIDEEGQVATAYTLATMLGAIPLSFYGPCKLLIFDIHALQERFYFGLNVIPLLQSAIPLLQKQLKIAHSNEKIAIAFPDEGALKRFGRFFEATYPLVLCSKVRQGDKRIVTIKEGNPHGYHCVIVDDLVKTGGTIIEAKNCLFEHGAARVSAFVTHAVFPQDSWKRIAYEKVATNSLHQPFQIFYTTDSCPTVAKTIRNIKPFQILPLAPLIVECIQKYRL
jgi:ribose-phosphate pyrophosphokinase